MRTVRGWTVHTCVNCGCDVYAECTADKSFVALNPSLRLCTGRAGSRTNESETGLRFSPVFHVLVDADPPPLSEGQGPPLGDARAAEVFATLQSEVQRYYEEEQRLMTARIAAYMEQEEKQLERLRTQALRDRDALWHRLRSHAISQLRTASQQQVQMSASSSASLTPTDGFSPSADVQMRTTPVLITSAPADSAIAESPSTVHPSTSAPGTLAPTAVIAQTPLGPETEDDRHRLFAFDEEIPAALFQSPSLGPQEVAAMTAFAAAAEEGDDEGDGLELRQRLRYQESGPTTPTMEPIALEEDGGTEQAPPHIVLGRSRRAAGGRVLGEDFAGFAMHGMPARPVTYSASLPVSVPPTPSRRTTTSAQGQRARITVTQAPGGEAQQQQQQQSQQQQSQQSQQLLEAQPSPNTETAAPLQAPLGGDMARSFAVPLSSSRRLRALYL